MVAAGGAGNLNRLHGGSAGGARLEGGIRFGLGSTLAMSRAALTRAGGLGPLVDSLADDYEMGARIAQAGYRVELCSEVVETTVPAYGLRGFCEHQLRWARGLAQRAALGLPGAGNHLLHSVGHGELRGERISRGALPC